jgi:hypothetical protein
MRLPRYTPKLSALTREYVASPQGQGTSAVVLLQLQ